MEFCACHQSEKEIGECDAAGVYCRPPVIESSGIGGTKQNGFLGSLDQPGRIQSGLIFLHIKTPKIVYQTDKPGLKKRGATTMIPLNTRSAFGLAYSRSAHGQHSPDNHDHESEEEVFVLGGKELTMKGKSGSNGPGKDPLPRAMNSSDPMSESQTIRRSPSADRRDL